MLGLKRGFRLLRNEVCSGGVRPRRVNLLLVMMEAAATALLAATSWTPLATFFVIVSRSCGVTVAVRCSKSMAMVVAAVGGTATAKADVDGDCRSWLQPRRRAPPAAGETAGDCCCWLGRSVVPGSEEIASCCCCVGKTVDVRAKSSIIPPLARRFEAEKISLPFSSTNPKPLSVLWGVAAVTAADIRRRLLPPPQRGCICPPLLFFSIPVVIALTVAWSVVGQDVVAVVVVMASWRRLCWNSAFRSWYTSSNDELERRSGVLPFAAAMDAALALAPGDGEGVEGA